MKNGTGILLAVSGAVCGLAAGMRIRRGKNKTGGDKFRDYYYILDGWLTLTEEGGSTASYFKESRFRTVIIYGWGSLGRHLYRELSGTDIKVVCVVDRNPGQTGTDVEIKGPWEELPPADMAVVTATHDFEAIEKGLREKVDCPIVSLEDVILAAMGL